MHLLIALLLAVQSGPHLKVCGVDWPPFSYAEQGNLMEGISVEIHQEVAHRLGMKLTLIELPWGRCEQYVNTELADGILDNAPCPAATTRILPPPFIRWPPMCAATARCKSSHGRWPRG